MAKKHEIDAVKLDALKVIHDLESGDTAYELSKLMTRVLNAVQRTGKEGSVTLKIKFQPIPKFGEAAISMTPKITTSEPGRDTQSIIRFLTEDGDLQRNDPNQLEFEFVKKNQTANASNEQE
jgi:hypothetical protein